MGDTAEARVEMAALAATEADLTRRGDTDWARVVAIKQQAVRAWVTLAAGDTAGALRVAGAAADLEDVMEKQPVTPAELLPARELQADMLLAVGHHRDAQAAYDATLTREPNRARSLFGAARAAELAGDREGARRRYNEFLAQMKTADGDREELTRARASSR
jgi:tetratricopeptide (TPR) repeat protein